MSRLLIILSLCVAFVILDLFVTHLIVSYLREKEEAEDDASHV